MKFLKRQIIYARISLMFSISKASNKEINEWGKQEWKKVNIENYGYLVDETEKHFRFKAEEYGKLIGLAVGKLQLGVIYLSDIVVSNKLRGKGVGTLLMAEVEKYAKQEGAHMIWLVTGKGLGSNTFYKKTGFKILTEIPNFYLKKDFVIYIKELK